MDNNGEDGETLFQSKRFPFGEHFWPHIQWPGDGSMLAAKFTKEQVSLNFVDYSMYIHGNISSIISKPATTKWWAPPIHEATINARGDWDETELYIRPGRACVQSRPIIIHQVKILGKLQFKVYLKSSKTEISPVYRHPFKTRYRGKGSWSNLDSKDFSDINIFKTIDWSKLTFPSEVCEQVDGVCKKS